MTRGISFDRERYIQTTLTPTTGITANTTGELTFSILGLQVNDLITINKPTLQAGLGIVNARVSAANTLAITYVNGTGGIITPTTEAYNIHVVRPDKYETDGSVQTR